MSDDLTLLLKLKADSSQATNEVKNFSGLLGRDLGGGSQFATAALRGVNTELANFVRQAPLVGQPLALLTKELFRVAAAGPRADSSLRAVGTAAKTFETQLGQAFLGGTKRADELALTFGRLGVNLEKGIGSSKVAFGQFITGLSGIAAAEDRAAVVAEVFRGQTAAVLPVLEAQVARMAAATVATEGLALSETEAAVAATAETAAVGGLNIALLAGVVGAAALAAGAAVTVGAIVSLAKSAAEAGGHIYDLAQRTDFSVETLSALKVALENSGGDLDRFTNGLIFFQKNIEKAAEAEAKGKGETDALAKSFRALKIDTTDNETALRSAFEQLSKLPQGYQQVALAQRLFRGSAKDVLGVIQESKGDFAAYSAELERMGVIISTKAAREADKFNDTLRLLEVQMAALKRQVGEEFIPVVLEALQSLSGFLRENRAEIVSWAAIVATAVEGGIGWVRSIYGIVNAVSVLTTGLRLGQVAAAALLGTLAQFGLLPDAEPKGFQGLLEPGGTGKPKGRIIDPADLAGGGGGRKRGGGGAADRTQEALKSLEDEAKAAEDTYKREVEADKRKYDLMLVSLADFTAKEITAETARYEAKKSVYLRERALVKDGTRPANEIDQKLREADETRTANTLKLNDTKNKKIEDAARAHETALLKLEDDAGNIRSLHIKAQLDANLLNHEQAEDALFAQTQAAIERRRAFLQGDDIGAGEGGELKRAGANSEARQKILDELALLDKQEEQGVEQHNQKLKVARSEDAQDRFNYLRTIKRIQADIAASGLAAQQQEIANLIRYHAPLVSLRTAELKLALDEADARHEANVQSIRDEEARAVAEVTLGLAAVKHDEEYAAAKERAFKKQLELHKLYNEQIEQEDARHDAETQAIIRNSQRDSELDNPNSTRSLFGDTFTDEINAGATTLQALGATAGEVFAQMSADAGNFTTILGGGLKQMVVGLGSIIQNFLTTGKVGKDAFRSLTVATLAHYAATFAIKAVDLIGQGFGYEAQAAAAAAAFDFEAAALYHWAATNSFIGAAKYGVGAGLAAGGALLLGRSGNQAAAGGVLNQGTATHQDTRTPPPERAPINLTRLPQIIQLHIVPSEAFAVKAVHDSLRNASPLRDHIIQIVGGDA